eukprot:m.243092 g.243092  ORF g.243092 m.243092 type:complete len:1093 (+) comp40234_c0_seq1:917-4195(+)
MMKTSLSFIKSVALVPSSLHLMHTSIHLLEVWKFQSNFLLMEALNSLTSHVLQDFGNHFIYLSHQLDVCDVSLHSFVCLVNIRAALAVAATRFLNLAVSSNDDSFPFSLVQSLPDLVIDQPMHFVYPSLQNKLAPYLKSVDQLQYEAFVKTVSLIKSFDFFNDFCQSLPQAGALDLVEAGLPTLAFYPAEGFIHKALDVCFEKYGTLRETSVGILLKLMAYPSERVRGVSYQFLVEKLRNGEGEPLIWEQDAIHEVAAFGLYDSSKEVSEASAKILTSLLRLFNTPNRLASFESSLPYIEGYLGEENEFNHLVMSLLNPVTDCKALLPGITKIKSLTRLLSAKNARIRSWALSAVCQQLYGKDPQMLTLASFDSLCDSFMPQFGFKPRKFSSGSPKKMDGGNLLRLFSVLMSSDIDVSLRKSASEQLVIILQNKDLHSPVLEASIVQQLVDFVSDLVENVQNATIVLLPDVLSILYLLSLASAAVCEQISCEIHLFSALIKGSLSLLGQRELEIGQHAACLFHVILFRHFAVHSSDEENLLNIPQQLSDRFSVLLTGTASFSAHRLPLKQTLFDDDKVQRNLRIAWHISASRNMDDFKSVTTKDESRGSDKAAPSLSDRDLALLRSLLPDEAIMKELESLEGAESHSDASACVERMALALSSVKGGELHRQGCLNQLARVVDKLQRALDRFLTVSPSNSDDEELLGSILEFLYLFLTVLPDGQCSTVVQWLGSLLNSDSSAAISCLKGNRSDGEETEIYSLFRQTVSLCAAFVEKAAFNSSSSWSLLLDSFLERLTGDGEFNLQILEIALESLFHISARLHWSSGWPIDSYFQFLASLIKILNVYDSSRIGAATSFMGKGIIRNSAFCLLHLAGEMRTFGSDYDWVKFCVKHSIQENPKSPFNWLWALLKDREAEVRCAGFGLSSLLCESVAGCQALFPSLGEDSQWMWHKAVHCFFNSSEACLVKQKAIEFLTAVVQNGSEVLSFNIPEMTFKGNLLEEITRVLAEFDPSRCLRPDKSLPVIFHPTSIPLAPGCDPSLSVNSVGSRLLPGAASTPAGSGVESTSKSHFVTRWKSLPLLKMSFESFTSRSVF